MSEKKVQLSVSRIKTYIQCPRKYYYSYIKKLPKKEWDHFSLGTFVHGVLEHFHSDFKVDNKDLDFKQIMKSACCKQRDIMQQKKEYLTPDIVIEAKKLLSGYIKKIEKSGMGSEIISLEDNFEIVVNEKCTIKGIVDRVDKDADGTLHIKDYKTNKSAKYMDSFQLQVYGIYLLNKYPDVERFRGSYVMLRFNDMDLSFDFNTEDTKKTVKEVVEYAEKILEEQRWIMVPSILCDYCDFKETCHSEW
jgi:putative RecB family exonuclease